MVSTVLYEQFCTSQTEFVALLIMLSLSLTLSADTMPSLETYTNTAEILAITRLMLI